MLTLACLGAVAHRSTAAANEGAVVVAYKAEHAGLMMQRRKKRESANVLRKKGKLDQLSRKTRNEEILTSWYM